jgi:putative transposase
MDNHVHFIVIPRKEDSLAKVFSISHMRYSQYFNKKKKASGHLWQGRFYSCVMDDDYLVAALRYVERNPVRAGIVRKPWRWKWSSAGVHVGQEDGVMNLEEITSLIDTTAEEWKEYIDLDENEEKVEEIRKHTLLGRPLGTKDFIAKLGKRIGRVLNVLPRGRPKKQRSDK